MKRLTWKECREKRLWMLLLVLSVVGVTAFRRPYTFLGLYNVGDYLWLPSAIVALLYGLTAYSSEIGWGTPDFLFSRPISWKKVLCVKLGVAFGTMLAAALLGAAVLRLWTPESHVELLAGYRLQGIGLAMLVMGLPYLAGLAVSVVFPGFLGSVIVLMAILAVAAAGLMFLKELIGYRAVACSVIIWPISALTAALVVARFGLTLTARERACRYGWVLVLGALLVGVLSLVPAQTWFVPSYSAYWFSPDGSYLVRDEVVMNLDDPKNERYEEARWLVRVSDGLARRLSWTEFVYGWTSDGTVYGVAYLYSGTTRGSTRIVTARIDQSGKLITSRFTPWQIRGYGMLPSPDGRYAALAHFIPYRINNRDGKYEFRFVDVPHEQTLSTIIQGVKGYWWQDNNTLGWIDKQDNRHLTRIGP